jgi:hypothetical protein
MLQGSWPRAAVVEMERLPASELPAADDTVALGSWLAERWALKERALASRHRSPEPPGSGLLLDESQTSALCAPKYHYVVSLFVCAAMVASVAAGLCSPAARHVATAIATASSLLQVLTSAPLKRPPLRPTNALPTPPHTHIYLLYRYTHGQAITWLGGVDELALSWHAHAASRRGPPTKPPQPTRD